MADAMDVYELFNAVSGLQINGDNEADFLAQVRMTPWFIGVCVGCFISVIVRYCRYKQFKP